MTVLVLSLGCTSYSTARDGARIGLYTVAAAAVIAAISGVAYVTHDTENGAELNGGGLGLILAAMVGGTGIVILGIGGIAMGVHASADSAEAAKRDQEQREQELRDNPELAKDCKARRAAALRAAHTLSDPDARTRALLSAPVCGSSQPAPASAQPRP